MPKLASLILNIIYTDMKNIFLSIILAFFAFLNKTNAQNAISGSVKDALLQEPLPGVHVKAVESSNGTTTDFDGKFTLNITKFPVTLKLSYIGFQTKQVVLSSYTKEIEIVLKENETELNEVVISASRTPERIMESPVTIERFDARAIKNTASSSFYNGLENLKGVDINTNSLTFQSINTRGFASFSNSRFMQLIDGVDNSSPALNFPLGNLLGISEIDVLNVELLPGASSALYGANAFNGIMFMTSKNPFDYSGVSLLSKTGITSQKAAGNNPFYDVSVRFAYPFNDKFAFKTTVSYLNAKDWYATDYRNSRNKKFISGTRESDTGYDGVNIYGDEVATNIKGVASGLVDKNILPADAKTIVPNARVSRTGYNEVDLMDYDAQNIKFDGALHYRPFDNASLEAIFNSKVAQGNTIYQGSNRYNMKKFFMHQHRLELKGENFFVRGYMSSVNVGETYDSRFAAININSTWKSNGDWFAQYTNAFYNAKKSGENDTESHKIARLKADEGRFLPGDSNFKKAFNKIIDDPDVKTGAKFVNSSKLYHADANLNLKNYIEFAEIQLGGSYRMYSLNSEGNVYTDKDGPINYSEFGVYTQAQKKLIEDKLKITASVRYDKADNFKGNFSSRLSLAYVAGEQKNHNFRVSVQQGFRNPTTQDQYIGLDVGRAFLIGSSPDNLDRYKTPKIKLSSNGEKITGKKAISIVGRDAYENAFSLSSVLKGKPKSANVSTIKPEKVTAYEIGYRGAIPVSDKKISVDMNVYYNTYKDFIANETVMVPLYGKVEGNELSTALKALQNGDRAIFLTYTNSSAEISSYGATIGINTKVFNGFDFGINYALSQFDFDQSTDPDFKAGFNTPKHKVKIQFGHNNILKNTGFSVNYRWQDTFLWQSAFLDGMIDARSVVDAQVNYRIPKIKSIFKIGATNLTGNEYYSAPGVGAIGSKYYISWTFNN